MKDHQSPILKMFNSQTKQVMIIKLIVTAIAHFADGFRIDLNPTEDPNTDFNDLPPGGGLTLSKVGEEKSKEFKVGDEKYLVLMSPDQYAEFSRLGSQSTDVDQKASLSEFSEKTADGNTESLKVGDALEARDEERGTAKGPDTQME